ncbi:hypothetical protein HK101_006720 [Irineochytrium annulatum]|nr:hypothetical protein HK101_006720 [Irineochytrium annulatum]
MADGAVTLHLAEQNVTRNAVIVSLKGVLDVNNYPSVQFGASKEIVQEAVVFYEKAFAISPCGDEAENLQPGDHAFAFSIPLNTAASFDFHGGDVNASITYRAIASFDVGGQTFTSDPRFFAFAPKAPDAFHLPLDAARSVQLRHDGAPKHVSLSFRVTRHVLVARSPSLLILNSHNGLHLNLKERVLQLVQKVRLLAKGATDERISRTVVARISLPGLNPGETDEARVVRLEVPDVPPTMKPAVGGLAIEYELNLIGRIEHTWVNVSASSPVVVLSRHTQLAVPDQVLMEETELERRSTVLGMRGMDGPLFNETRVGDGGVMSDEEVMKASAVAMAAKKLELLNWRKVELPAKGYVLFAYDLGDEEARKGVTSVILSADSDLAVRIQRGAVPTFESKTAGDVQLHAMLKDGATHEMMARLSDGSGKYYIGVYGSPGTRVSIKVDAHTKVLASLDLKSPSAPWVPFDKKTIPEKAWPAGYDLDGSLLYLARTLMNNGLHIGKVGLNLNVPSIPYGGKEHGVEGDVEILLIAPNARWVQTSGNAIPSDAVVSGYEDDGRPLYAARADVGKGLFGKKSSCPGKAGHHISGCNVPFDGKEVGVKDFEVLCVSPDEDESLAMQMAPVELGSNDEYEEVAEETQVKTTPPPPRMDGVWN